MSANLPDLSVEIAAQLSPKATASDALRAVLQVPAQLRFYGARTAVFFAGVLLAQDAEMREMSIGGLAASLDGYRDIRDLLALGPAITERTHHAVVRQILAEVMPEQAEAMSCVDRYGATIGDHLATFRAGDRPAPGAYDETMRFAYRVFHPSILTLSARMAQVGRTFLKDQDDRAMRARDRARSARGRIDEISRTVRLISFNARVEAARAGSAGRAFGVIAQEIKTLSEDAEEASEELAAGVEDMMANVRVV